MSKCARQVCIALFAVLILSVVILPAAADQAKNPPRSHLVRRLVQAADVTSQKGFHAKLPPHISTLLGLSTEQEFPVMQSVLRTEGKVQGFDVSVSNKTDIVIFVVDETAKNQTLYLTSPEGALRRVVSVQSGVGKRVARVTEEDRKAFEKEKQFWVDRLVPPPAAK